MSEVIRNPEIVNNEASKIQEVIEASGSESGIEKEQVHQVVGERIQEVANTNGVPAYTPKKPVSEETPSYLNPELQPLVQDLVNQAFSTGLNSAFDSALKSGNMALVDALHDAVVDELFDVVVERNNLKKLAA